MWPGARMEVVPSSSMPALSTAWGTTPPPLRTTQSFQAETPLTLPALQSNLTTYSSEPILTQASTGQRARAKSSSMSSRPFHTSARGSVPICRLRYATGNGAPLGCNALLSTNVCVPVWWQPYIIWAEVIDGCPFACAEGYYGTTYLETDPKCTAICPAGHMCPEGSGAPTPCAENTYQDSTGAALCKQCPTFSVTSGRNSTSLGDCKCQQVWILDACACACACACSSPRSRLSAGHLHGH